MKTSLLPILILSALTSVLAASTCDQVKALTKKTLNVNSNQIIPSASFTGDLGADDDTMVDLFFAFEEEFHLNMNSDDRDGITTVGDACDYVEMRLNAGGDPDWVREL